ncbi:MAG: hypothetical protein QXZ13_03970 [Candidatus Diapherotrites archaeon]
MFCDTISKIKFKLKYPKLLLLFLSFVFAYFILADNFFEPFIKPLLDLNYFGAYLLGMFFAYGFTSAPATALLIKLSNVIGDFPTALLGGLGALSADYLIFSFIRHSFMDEIQKLSSERIFQEIYSRFSNKKIVRTIMPVFGGLIIASPLPDEIGVALLASSLNVSTKFFVFMCFVLNTLGIYFIVSIV